MGSVNEYVSDSYEDATGNYYNKDDIMKLLDAELNKLGADPKEIKFLENLKGKLS
jgi:hypothetical protein